MTQSVNAFDGVLTSMADGKSLREACKADGAPAVTTVLRRLASDDEFRLQYMRAREAGDDAMAEDIQDIADDGELKPDDKRVRIDARKWLLGKRQPKKYGDRVDVAHSGELVTVIERRIVRANADDPDS